MMSKKDFIEFFGYKIHNLTMQETVTKIDNYIIKKKCAQHVVINVAKIVNSNNDRLLKNSIKTADIVNIDGAGIIYGMKLLGLHPKERVTGIDLMMELIKLSEIKRYSVYFLGSTTHTLEKLLINIKIKFPSLIIAGNRNGYWDTIEEEKLIVKEIAKTKPNILFVGISSPKKEYFISKNKNYLNSNLIMGVGGSFDIYANITKRAPLFFQNYGMEWIYRIYQEPARMWKRYLITNTKYFFMLIIEFFSLKNHNIIK